MDIKCKWRMEIDLPDIFDADDYQIFENKVNKLYMDYVNNTITPKMIRKKTFCPKCDGLLPGARMFVPQNTEGAEYHACPGHEGE
jgi:hypothetical protein